MRRIPLLAGMALRELWISYRLLLMLILLLAAALPTVVLPRTATAALSGAPPGPLTWYAVACAAALGIASGVAAWSIAATRRHGTAAWLAVRAVPRASILLGWFVGAGSVVVVGSTAAALLAWLVLGGESGVLASTVGYAATVAAVAAGGLVAVAVGLLLGALLRPAPAALLSAVIFGIAAAAAAGGVLGMGPEPLGGLAQLAHIELERRPAAVGLVSTGLALAVVAALLSLASAVLERMDL